MYVFSIVVLLFVSGLLIYRGLSQRQSWTVTAGLTLAALTLLFFAFLDFWLERLWFGSLGFSDRFWLEVYAKVGLSALVGAIAALAVFLFTRLVFPGMRGLFRWSWVLGGVAGGIWGSQNWETFLLYWYRVDAPFSDPILHKNLGFYFFALPFYDQVYWLMALLAVLPVLAGLSRVLGLKVRSRGGLNLELRSQGEVREGLGPLEISLGVLLLVLAAGRILATYHLLFSDWGVVAGPGWTDIHIRLPAYYLTFGVTVIGGLILIWSGFRRPSPGTRVRWMMPLGLTLASLSLIWLVALLMVPGLVQWLMVEPNEITFEKPYIAHNIELTRYAFGLQDSEEREFPATEAFGRETVDSNQELLSEVRLWDWRALDAVYKQFQEIRLYYEFVDVDIDRYTFGGRYRQVMVSPREMQLSNLPDQSQTFVNRRFKYTHGYGITLTPVSEFTAEGLPNLLVRDIPPKSKFPALEVTRPEIYYGELTRTPVFVNTEEEEFDYPSGETNRYTRYTGKGGVSLNGLWRRFLVGWRFDGTRLVFSSYPNSQSRVLFRRNIRDRIQVIAPFLKLDDDPYIVLSEGKLYWMVDAYTSSRYFPYSAPFDSTERIEYRNGSETFDLVNSVSPHLAGVNYVRNSVKIVVDAYEGTVQFYVFDPQDPILQVYRRIFPGLFKDREEMPDDLEKHIRYPENLLLSQGLMAAKYHMTDPEVFYNQEDLWVRATEKYYGHVQPVEPYYIMWEPADSDRAEFTLILPFTPKNRQVLIGWIAGMCDPGNYGRFLTYKFPKEKRILGPQQVETKIDQDPFLSGQLSLWDQRGSSVIRGNVLAIPIGETLLYVEPIYLQAETAAYPELRLVALMHDDQLSYAETFDKALAGLLEGTQPAPRVSLLPATTQNLAQRAQEAFRNYLDFQSQERFSEAAEELEKLRDLLQQMVEQSGSASPPQD